MGDRLRKVMSIANKIKYRRSLKSRVKLRIQIVISNFIMRMWNKYLRRILIGLILISYGVTGTVIFILLSASHKVIINTAEAEEVSGNARELNQKDNPVTPVAGLEPSKVDGASVTSLIRKYDWDAEKALNIMKCESQGDPTKIGDRQLKRPSFGLFQVNTFYNPQYDETKLLDPAYNIQAAYEIYSKGGWGRWTCNKLI